MKVDISKKGPYQAVIDLIRIITLTEEGEDIQERAVWIKVGPYKHIEYLGVNDDGYYFANEWYDPKEGDVVELMGFENMYDLQIKEYWFIGDHDYDEELENMPPFGELRFPPEPEDDEEEEEEEKRR